MWSGYRSENECLNRLLKLVLKSRLWEHIVWLKAEAGVQLFSMIPVNHHKGPTSQNLADKYLCGGITFRHFMTLTTQTLNIIV